MATQTNNGIQQISTIDKQAGTLTGTDPVTGKSTVVDIKTGKVITPTTITSGAATTDLNNIKNYHADAVSGIQSQAEKNAATLANSKATADAKAKADLEAKNAADLKAQKDKELALKAGALGGGTTPTLGRIGYTSRMDYSDPVNYPNGRQIPTDPATGLDIPQTDANGKSTDTSTMTDEQKAQKLYDDKTAEIAKKGEEVAQQILNIQNGTTPLSAAEQAQIDGLKKQFDEMIRLQTLTNTGATGTMGIKGYQSGGEYDPFFQINTIGSIVTAGQNKITDLQVKEASAVADLTQAFKTNDINVIKSVYDIANNARLNSQTALKETVTKIQDAINKAKEDKIKADKVQYDQVTKPIQDIAADAAKNGADKKTIDAITKSQDVTSAIGSAGMYLQTGTGTLGDYLQYKKDTTQKGLVPMDYQTFKDKQDAKDAQRDINKAYSVAKATAQGKAAGEPAGTTYDENGNVIATGNLSTLDINRYNLAATRATKTFRESMVFKAAQNAEFYLTKIKAATEGTGSIGDQEILDSISQFNTGGGRVTETQTDLILKGKSLNDTINAWSNKLKNGGILSDNQRKQALELASATAKGFQENYKTKYDNLASNLDKQKIPKEFWGIPSPEQLSGEVSGNADPKTQVDDYITSNPAQGENIAKLYELPGWDDTKVLDYINQLNKK